MLPEELRPSRIAQRTAFDEAGADQIGIKPAHRMVVINVHGIRDGIAVIKANENGIDSDRPAFVDAMEEQVQRDLNDSRRL